jgi:RNA polymerase sigma-70 factor (ECF subfamily)
MSAWDSPNPPRPGLFPETLWGVVTHQAEVTAAKRERVWEEFCRVYWRPVFALVRRRGFGPSEAEDLTQDFLLHFLRSDALTRVCPEKGKLRDFLKGALDHYLINYRERLGAEKRGGKFFHVGLDDPAVAKLCAEEETSPDESGRSRDDADLSSLGEALAALEAQYARKGRGRLFAWLKLSLTNKGSASAAALARGLGRSPATLRSDAKRFREKLRKLLRDRKQPAQDRSED